MDTNASSADFLRREAARLQAEADRLDEDANEYAGKVMAKQIEAAHRREVANNLLADAELLDGTPEKASGDADEMACDWADYRKDYGIASKHMSVAHKAFVAGWTAGRNGEQSSVQR